MFPFHIFCFKCLLSTHISRFFFEVFGLLTLYSFLFPLACMSCTLQGASAYTDRYASQETFEPRSPEEVEALCRAWEHYVHPRAREFWQTAEARIEILRKSKGKRANRKQKTCSGEANSHAQAHSNEESGKTNILYRGLLGETPVAF